MAINRKNNTEKKEEARAYTVKVERVREIAGKRDSYRFNLLVDLMQNELFYVYVDDLGLIESDDEKVYDRIMKDFISVSHVYIAKNTADAKAKVKQAERL